MMNEFTQTLLDKNSENPFPYIDPDTSWKAPIYVDYANYVDWYDEIILKGTSQGYCISFVVGSPGAGKTHFLCHLNYLYYNENKYNGFYSIYSAGQEIISQELLWKDFLNNRDLVDKIKKSLFIWEVELYRFPKLDMKELVKRYVENPTIVNTLNIYQLKRLAIGLSHILSSKNMHMTMVIDNIDEYFRWNNIKNNIHNEEGQNIGVSPNKEMVDALFSTLRNIATNMKNFVIMLSCTVESYNPIRTVSEISDDRTFASRISYQDKVIHGLDDTKAYELIAKYLYYWCEINNVEQPVDNECIVDMVDGTILNIYPFSKQSIREILLVGEYARDVKTICMECIDEMKISNMMWVVKEDRLISAIEKAHINRPDIITDDKLKMLYDKIPILKSKSLYNRLDEVEKIAIEKYKIRDEKQVINIFNRYLQILGLIINAVNPIKNTYNSAYMTDITNLGIITIQNDDRIVNILISYIVSEKSPINNQYFKKIELRDMTDALSYLEEELVEYIIFIRYWSGIFKDKNKVLSRKLLRYDNIIDDIVLDDHIDKIFGAIYDAKSEDEVRELVQYMEDNYIGFTSQITRLLSQGGIIEKSWEERLRELRRWASEF